MASKRRGLEPLSETQWRDVVPVMTARSVPEAHFWVAVLEREGVPATVQGDALASFGEGSPRVCVPRSLVEEAHEALVEAQSDPVERGVRKAFTEDEDKLSEEELSADRVLEKMASVRELPDPQREERLIEYINEWLGAGIGSVRIARYLAVSGLTYDRACVLMERVLKRKRS